MSSKKYTPPHLRKATQKAPVTSVPPVVVSLRQQEMKNSAPKVSYVPPHLRTMSHQKYSPPSIIIEAPVEPVKFELPESSKWKKNIVQTLTPTPVTTSSPPFSVHEEKKDLFVVEESEELTESEEKDFEDRVAHFQQTMKLLQKTEKNDRIIDYYPEIGCFLFRKNPSAMIQKELLVKKKIVPLTIYSSTNYLEVTALQFSS